MQVFSPLDIYNIKNYDIQLFLIFCFRMSHLFRIIDSVCGDLEFNIIIMYADTNYSQIVALHGIKAKYWMI